MYSTCSQGKLKVRSGSSPGSSKEGPGKGKKDSKRSRERKVVTVDNETQFELVDKSNLMSSLNYLNLESRSGLSALEQTLPKVWSNPQISDHIRWVHLDVNYKCCANCNCEEC
jgi:hypothetical protein